jgi:serine O-acetyltransferase
MARDPDFIADLARYPSRPFLREQSIWAIYVYRWGRRILQRPPGLMQNMLLKFYWLLFRLVETITGISLPLEAQIGPGLRIYHFGNIFINSDVIIGRNCTLRQGVTLGNRVEGGPSPKVEDDVEFGAYAQAFGGIRIAKGAKIGAMSVVLSDVPAGATAVGIPAHIVKSGSHDRSSP